MIEVECIKCGAKALLSFFVWGYLCDDCTRHYEETEIQDCNETLIEMDRIILFTGKRNE